MCPTSVQGSKRTINREKERAALLRVPPLERLFPGHTQQEVLLHDYHTSTDASGQARTL